MSYGLKNDQYSGKALQNTSTITRYLCDLVEVKIYWGQYVLSCKISCRGLVRLVREICRFLYEVLPTVLLFYKK